MDLTRSVGATVETSRAIACSTTGHLAPTMNLRLVSHLVSIVEPEMRIPGIATTVFVAIVCGGCARGLSYEQAKQRIESNSLIRPASDSVKVEAISASAENEAVVRAKIADHSINLKFRRYDTGWTWEFVETKSGGWIAPDAAIAEIREENRQPRITKWAEKNAITYARAVKMVDRLTDYLPTLESDSFSVSGWMARRAKLAEVIESINITARSRPQAFPGLTDEKRIENEAIVKQLKDLQMPDPWGHALVGNFDIGDHQALIASAGIDGKPNSADDIACFVVGAKRYEDGRFLWRYVKKWKVPEGLQALMAEYIAPKAEGSAEYAKVIEP
jgi:hypothetical protein